MAAHGMRAAERSELRTFGFAALGRAGAAVFKRAARRKLRGVRHHAGNRLEPRHLGIQIRQRVEKALRVRVRRVLVNVPQRAVFHDHTAVHDGDLVAHFGHNAKIVRNEDGRGVELRLELSHELEHLRLDRHVERGRGLVGDEKLGAAGQGNGDDHALLHAAGECSCAVKKLNQDKGSQGYRYTV